MLYMRMNLETVRTYTEKSAHLSDTRYVSLPSHYKSRPVIIVFNVDVFIEHCVEF